MFFTVAIATYNRSKLLKRCLDSIKKQIFKDYEVLILDDCSSDDTPEVVREYTKDKRFRYIRFDKNHGSGDKVYKEAQDSGWFVGEWVALMADDEYYLNTNHLKEIHERITSSHQMLDLIAVSQIYDYDGIVVGVNDVKTFVELPKHFLYDKLNVSQKEILKTTIRVVFRTEFLAQTSFLDADKQGTSDVVYEGDAAYALIYSIANISYVENAYHVFGMEKTARRKYLDFYNFIVSLGEVALFYHDTFYITLRNYYENHSAFINAFFDWGGEKLASLLDIFKDSKSYSKYLREIANIYKDNFQEQFYQEYEVFNQELLSVEERSALLAGAQNIVLYGDGNWREEIELYLKKLGKNIMFVVDDAKKECKSYKDIIENRDNIDLVFITSGSPKVIKKMMDNLKNIDIQIATLHVRDVGWIR